MRKLVFRLQRPTIKRKIIADKLLIVLLSVVLGIGFVYADDSTKTNKAFSESSISIETSLTFPVVQIYMAQFGFLINENNTFLIGPCFQNWKDQADAKGRAQAYTLIVGYRYYPKKNLNFEIELFPAYNKFNSTISGQTYNGFEVWSEYRMGWKYDFTIKKRNFYVIPQPGFSYGLYMQNIWPGLKRDSWRKGTLTFVPQIIFGVRL